jgi:ferritin-like metal-binding protein YciE
MSLTKDLESMLHEYLADMHALEKHSLRELDVLISTTREEQIRAAFRRHRSETKDQIARLEARLEAHYKNPSDLKDVSAQFIAFLKALGNLVREDKPAKNARDAFVVEHLEIAMYEILERLAIRAGDPKTAEVAQQNRAEEQAMAGSIAANWDSVIRETLAEEGVLEQATG